MGSDGARGPVHLRFTLITAGALLALLGLVWGFFELRRPTVVLVEGPLEMPPWPSSARPDDAEEAAEALRFTPEMVVDGPTTLTVELERERFEGWVGVSVALIHPESGQVRELGLSTEWREGPDDAGRGQLTARAVVDRVQAGTWLARLEPGWDPLAVPRPGRVEAPGEEAAQPPPPGAHVRITQNAGAPAQLWIALGLILLPAVVQIGRWLWYKRRQPTPRVAADRGGDR